MLRGRSVPAVIAVALLIAAHGCTDLKREAADGESRTDGGTDEPVDERPPSDGGARKDSGPEDAGTAAFSSYAEAAQALAALPTLGPLTAQGSVGYCAGKNFFWRDGNGAFHSWNAETTARTDYGFNVPPPSFFAPSDVFVPVRIPVSATVNAFRVGSTLADAGTMPDAYGVAATSDGLLRMEKTGIPPSENTRVRKWAQATGAITDVAASMPTGEPASSFGLGQLVIVGGPNMPFALYIVDVTNKTTRVVTMDGGSSLTATLPTAHGLVVSYLRTTGPVAIRLYKDYLDVAGSRYEIGDDLTNRASPYSDAPATSHVPNARIARKGDWLVYDSAFGIWAYHLVTGELRPVQLGANKGTLFVDTLCVLEDANVLVYRKSGDTLGQIYVVPLATILP